MPGGRADREAWRKARWPRLCRWCNLEVPSRRFTFCSELGVCERVAAPHDPGYLREQVFRRDRGILRPLRCEYLYRLFDLKRSEARTVKSLARWGLKRINRRVYGMPTTSMPVIRVAVNAIQNLRSTVSDVLSANRRWICVVEGRRPPQA